MKNPNGYGSVYKLSGKRRKPYRVRVGCTYTSDGVRLTETRATLGYYRTRAEAMQALAEYNRSPYDISGKTTFAEVYALWMAEKEVAKQTKNAYNAAFRKCAELHDRPLHELKLQHYQAIVDRYSDTSRSNVDNIKTVISGICEYGMRFEMIPKDYSKYIRVKHAPDKEIHDVFTEEEIQALWNEEPSEVRDMTIILIYSGWRISELLELDDLDLADGIMTGGKKTRAGKGRIVPIHHRITDIVTRYPGGFTLTDAQYRKALKEGYNHLPHDTRHTFVSRLQTAGADHVCIERLAGHASKGVTDKIYTHKDIEELRKTVEMLA